MGSSAKALIATFFFAVVFQANPTTADLIGDAIKESISNSISSMFMGAINFIINTVKNAVRWVFEKILGFFTNLAPNMTASMARAWPMAKELVSSRADTLRSTLNSLQEYRRHFFTKLILSTMYTGPLGEEFYLRPVNLEDEIQHLEPLFNGVFYDAIITCVLVCFLAVLYLILLCLYCNHKIQQRKISKARKLFLQKVVKQKKNKVKEQERVENLQATIIEALTRK